jgi:enamine deaminase RidA (YjgF/YER057c/UK114 family)
MIEKEYMEPNEGFSQTVVVKTGNFKTLYISGQIGDGNDLEAQTITTFQNLEQQLTNCNATFKDVVKMNTYIVNFNPEVDLPVFRKVRKVFLGNENYPASTLVGVKSLGRKEWLIEIEATAIVEYKIPTKFCRYFYFKSFRLTISKTPPLYQSLP